MTADQEKRLAAKWSGYAWWHGVPNFWLLRDTTGSKSAGTLRDEIREIAPVSHLIVIDIDPKTWAGSSMNESNRNWLKNWWPPEGE